MVCVHQHIKHSKKAVSAPLGNCLEHLNEQVIPKLVNQTWTLSLILIMYVCITKSGVFKEFSRS